MAFGTPGLGSVVIDIVFIYRYKSEPFMRRIPSMYSIPRLGERVDIRHEPGMRLVYAVHSIDWIFKDDETVEVRIMLA